MFVDSSYWVGVVDPRDQWHRRAQELRARVPLGASVLDLTVAEAVTIVGSRQGAKAATELYRFFCDSCRVIFVDDALLDRSMDLHLARDGKLSLTDCATIRAMLRDRDRTILSFDSDFDSVPGITRLH